MRFQSSLILAAASLLASGVSARPRTRVPDHSGPVEQRSHLTAFIQGDEGVKVECWEIQSHPSRNMQQSSQHRDPKDTVQVTSMDIGDGGLVGVSILTWPYAGVIYPTSDDRINVFGGSGTRSSFTVKHGLVLIQTVNARTSNSVIGDQDSFVFDLNNGDDWFYFEDDSSSSRTHAKTGSNPITILADSGSETTLISFQYEATPPHKVLHGGRCNFAGLKPPTDSARNEKDVAMIRLTVEDY